MKTQPASTVTLASSASLEALPLTLLAGKYLTFFLGGETYGLPVLKVREIISMLPITQVPQGPRHYMKGVINLRGSNFVFEDDQGEGNCAHKVGVYLR